MRDTHAVAGISEVAVVLALGDNRRALWRGFGLIEDDIYALVELGSESMAASDAGLRGTSGNIRG